jgi:hypothetical protein
MLLDSVPIVVIYIKGVVCMARKKAIESLDQLTDVIRKEGKVPRGMYIPDWLKTQIRLEPGIIEKLDPRVKYTIQNAVSPTWTEKWITGVPERRREEPLGTPAQRAFQQQALQQAQQILPELAQQSFMPQESPLQQMLTGGLGLATIPLLQNLITGGTPDQSLTDIGIGGQQQGGGLGQLAGLIGPGLLSLIGGAFGGQQQQQPQMDLGPVMQQGPRMGAQRELSPFQTAVTLLNRQGR